MTRYSSLGPLPERLSRLDELAIDLWWSWNEARLVFRHLDYTLWRATAHNPVRMLWAIGREKLAAAAADPEFLRLYDAALEALDAARAARNTWWTGTFPHLEGQSIAFHHAVLNQYVRVAFDEPIEPFVAVQEPDDDLVHEEQRRRPEQSARDAVVVADDRVLDGIGQREQDNEIERVQLCQLTLAREAKAGDEKEVDDDRAQNLLGDR